MFKAYADGAPSVNREIQRRNILAALDLVTTDELIAALGCSKATLAELRQHGLEQIGAGKQKFYRASTVAAAMERETRSRNGMEANDEQ